MKLRIPFHPAIVFDFDGVLVDSEPVHWAALMTVLAPLGFHLDYEVFRERYTGLDDTSFFHRIWREQDWPEETLDLPLLRAGKAQALCGDAVRNVRSFPGVIETVLQLGAKHPLAICSGSRRNEIEALLGSLVPDHLRENFRAIVSRDDVQAPKPSPEGYLAAARRLGYPPTACLAIEDTAVGIQAALNAGLSVLAVGHTQPLEQLTQANWQVPCFHDADWSEFVEAR